MIVPNRSFLAFQRPADKSAYGWSNSTPYLLAHNIDTDSYYYTNIGDSSYNIKYFCKDGKDSNFKKTFISPLSGLHYLDIDGTVNRIKFNDSVEFSGSYANGYFNANNIWNQIGLRLEIFDPNSNIIPDEYVQNYIMNYNILECDI